MSATRGTSLEPDGDPADLLQKVRRGDRIPEHIAVIMDGNGRWASARGLPRFRGHTAGMRSVREVVEGAIQAGVSWLTLFAFSQENWNRPAREIGALMRLLDRYVTRERDELIRQGVRVRVFGDLEPLDARRRRAIEDIEQATREGKTLALQLMLSYGSRAEIVRATRRLAEKVGRGFIAVGEIDEAAFEAELFTAGVPDPDLLIRTSGEQRISNFLLWQVAYTELYVTPVLWPDFDRAQLFTAILDYQRRERRFGRVPSS
ncbi:MAG: polyprenyl diphosphate synthase [Gemmatimonadetes bacterium]|nr:polyprenyl diphosphate synthase [Gemmatimonadota bacterium]